MVSKYRKKVSAFPHARLGDATVYREIVKLSLTGYNTQEIASRLSLPPQTVARNLRKIREGLADNKDFRSSFYKIWLRYDAQFITECYEDIFDKIWRLSFFKSSDTLNFNSFVTCITNCPVTKSPKNFVTEHLKIYELGGKDCLNFPSAKSQHCGTSPKSKENFELFIEKKKQCKICPFNGKYKNTFKGRYKSMMYGFSVVHFSFLDLIFYLSKNRITEQNNYYHVHHALLYSLIRVTLHFVISEGRTKKISEEVQSQLIDATIDAFTDEAILYLIEYEKNKDKAVGWKLGLKERRAKYPLKPNL